MGMGMKSLKWEGIGTKNLFPHTSTWNRNGGNVLASSCTTSFMSVLTTFTSNNTHTSPFNSPLSGTTRVSQYQKGKTYLDFTEVRDSKWQWHQLGHMQVCTLLQTDTHAGTPPLSFYRPDAIPVTQPTALKH